MDWLKSNHALIDCYDMVVSFCVLEQAVFHYRCRKTYMALRAGLLAHVKFGNSASDISEIGVVFEYKDVFQEIPELPPRRVTNRQSMG